MKRVFIFISLFLCVFLVSQVRGDFESGLVDDTAYDATTWNGVTGVAPSKNAVRDKIEALSVPTAVTVADTTDTTAYVGLFESATGDLGPKTDAGITYNAATGMLTATGLTGPLTGTASGNIANTLMSAKGDMIVSSAANTPARLAHPGATGYLPLTNGTDTIAWSNSLNISTLYLPSSDAAPGTAAGNIRHDTAVTSYPASGGAVSWYDGFVVRNLCDSGGCVSPKLNEDVAVTTTATKLNYLTSATGTTGTASTNIVFSTSPALTTPTVATSIAPASADGATLGTSALEFSDLYLAAGGIIYGENDQSNTITSSATGWTFAKPITVSDVTNDNYIKITNNSGGRAPTASVYELYPDAGIWKFNVNGTEYIPLLSNLATNAYDAANSVWAESNNIVMEGATANEYETRITPTDPTADRTITIPDATGTVQVNCTATHDYAAGATDWTLTVAEMQCGFITATNANGAVNAILPSAIPGKTYTVNNGTGQVLTFKVTGQTGGTVANGKWGFYTTLAADVAEVYELP